MALMDWGPVPQVGYRDIDDQHMRLVELVNELDDAMRAGKAHDMLEHVLTELVNYTVFHFAFEEELMDRYQVSSTETHKAEHRQLVADVADFATAVRAGTGTVSTDLMAFLRDWLGTHILKTDKALAKELLARGARSVA
jgi:hemerythrin